MNDKTFEILTSEGSFHMGRIKVGMGRADRVAQSSSLTLKCQEEIELPMQVHFTELFIKPFQTKRGG